MKKTFLIAMLLAVISLPALLAQDATEPKVKKRKERQQARIAQGVASGSLSPKETANLEKKEAKINGEVARDRAANGGPLSAKQKRKINHQQNKMSDQINDKKHN